MVSIVIIGTSNRIVSTLMVITLRRWRGGMSDGQGACGNPLGVGEMEATRSRFGKGLVVAIQPDSSNLLGRGKEYESFVERGPGFVHETKTRIETPSNINARVRAIFLKLRIRKHRALQI